MKWTKQAPTVPGYYWLNQDGFKQVIWIIPTPNGIATMDGADNHLALIKGLKGAEEWAGPIPEPGEGGEG